MRQIVMWILIAAILLTEGFEGAPQPEADFKAVRAEILAIENQWATAIERPPFLVGNRDV